MPAGTGPVSAPLRGLGPDWAAALADWETLAGRELGRVRGLDGPGFPGVGRGVRNRGARCVTGCTIWPRRSARRRKDGTLPELAFDRIWITAEGRAKLLDFPVPGPFGRSETRSPKPESNAASPAQPAQRFLADVAAAALAGNGAASGKDAGEVAAPLPLHARTFLRDCAQMAGADAVVAALKPLLSRVAAVSRLRRGRWLPGAWCFLC